MKSSRFITMIGLVMLMVGACSRTIELPRQSSDNDSETPILLAAVNDGQKISSDGGAGDGFGYAVALDGDTVVIGAPSNDPGGIDEAGAAYVFTRTGTAWTLQAKLLPADGATGDWFGRDVGISGDTVIVGAPRDDDKGNNSGSAYVFTRTGTTWTLQAKLTASDGATDDGFGWRGVAVNGDTVIVGAWHDDDNGANSGSAYIFTRTGTTWTQQAKLLPGDGAAGDEFGISAALEGDTVIVGSHWDDDKGSKSGSAYIFTRAGTTWTQQAKLVASDGATDDVFGRRVALSDDTAIVGAWKDRDNGFDSGSAYIFTRSGTTWTEQAKLLASDGGSPGQIRL